MENFTAISKRPFFSQSIRMIFYDTVLYDMYIPELTSNQRSREPGGEESYRHGLNVYRRAYADHEAILDTGEDFAVLKTGLDLMPDVKEVRVLDGLRYKRFATGTTTKIQVVGILLRARSRASLIAYPITVSGAPWDSRIIQHIFRALSLRTWRLLRRASRVTGALFPLHVFGSAALSQRCAALCGR